MGSSPQRQSPWISVANFLYSFALLTIGITIGSHFERNKERYFAPTDTEMVHSQNKAEIDSVVERWYFEKGFWPKADLSDIGNDPNFFPDGLPTKPQDGSAYTLNAQHRAQ